MLRIYMHAHARLRQFVVCLKILSHDPMIVERIFKIVPLWKRATGIFYLCMAQKLYNDRKPPNKS